MIQRPAWQLKAGDRVVYKARNCLVRTEPEVHGPRIWLDLYYQPENAAYFPTPHRLEPFWVPSGPERPDPAMDVWQRRQSESQREYRGLLSALEKFLASEHACTHSHAVRVAAKDLHDRAERHMPSMGD